MLARLPSYLPWDRISRDLYVSRLIKGVNRYPIDASVRLLFRLIICENYSTGIRDIRAIVPISSSPYFSISSVLSVFFSPHHRAILYPTERKRERSELYAQRFHDWENYRASNPSRQRIHLCGRYEYHLPRTDDIFAM